MSTENFGPLQGIRVIEMGQLLAGPFVGSRLADFGAEVIKIETPGAGDPMREWGHHRYKGKSLWWPTLARNKKSVTVNLREKKGQEIVRKLLASADGLIENFKPGTLEKWGMSPEELHKINPKLIIVRVSGFGQTGPSANRPGFASIGEAMGGIRFINGFPNTPPPRFGISLGDTLTAMFAVEGFLMALFEREKNNGKGQIVDAAITESCFSMLESTLTEYDKCGIIRKPSGTGLANVAPSNIFETKDNQMILIGANQDGVFARLCKIMDQPELSSDEKYSTHSARGKNQKELDDLINDWTKTKNLKEIELLCNDNGIPAGLIYKAKDMIEDPHFKARQAIIDITHPEFGKIKMQNVAPKLSNNPGKVYKVGPILGEHNNYVFKEILQKSEDEIKNLKESGVI